MTGIGGGLMIWLAVKGLMMWALGFLISLGVRRFLNGMPLVVVSMSFALLVVLLGAASGMAKSDFTTGFALPYFFCAMAIALVWFMAMKLRAAHG